MRRGPIYPDPQPPTQDAGNPRQPSTADQMPTPAQIQQMLARLESLETNNTELRQRLSDQYMQSIANQQAQQQARAQNPTPAPATNNQTSTATTTADSTTPSDPTANAAPADLGAVARQELLDALVQQIVDGEDPQRVQALMVAALSLASENHELDHTLLDQLDPRSREQVARFQQMLAVTYEELASDDTHVLTRRAMLERIDEVFGQQPLTIEALQLCRRVDGYGVYNPFPNTRFLAGRTNRVLVYVELENFQHEPAEDNQFEVRLEMQVELYDSTGETTVWRSGPEVLADVSRNQRRDFFIVYPIDLPARLTAGSYRLKVRVADMHTGSICEQTVHDIQIVADQSLVTGQ